MAGQHYLDLHDCTQCQKYWERMEATEDVDGFINISDAESAEIREACSRGTPQVAKVRDRWVKIAPAAEQS